MTTGSEEEEENPSLPPPSALLYRHLLLEGSGYEDYDWRPLRPGIEIFRLYGDGEQGPSAALLRYEKGAKLAPHRHTGHETLLILRGSQKDERGRYATGDVIVNLPGSSHSVQSDEGCVLLALWSSPVQFED